MLLVQTQTAGSAEHFTKSDLTSFLSLDSKMKPLLSTKKQLSSCSENRTGGWKYLLVLKTKMINLFQRCVLTLLWQLSGHTPSMFEHWEKKNDRWRKQTMTFIKNKINIKSSFPVIKQLVCTHICVAGLQDTKHESYTKIKKKVVYEQLLPIYCTFLKTEQ